MAQPEYVPQVHADRVVVAERLPVPTGWVADRPGEIKPSGGQPVGPRLGSQGPDQGYALRLASLVTPVLGAHEHLEDAVAGCVGVATRRSGLYGRGPTMHDVKLGFCLWGYLPGAPAELVAYRTPLFAGAAHHYGVQRAIVDAVPEPTLRLTPEDVAARLGGEWRALLGL